jgi:hypothetical protein
MPSSFSGGCACGAIRYRSEGEPLFSMNCHCRDCQRESGSAYAAVIGVARAGFTITKGRPTYFKVTADSGNATKRGFCGNCGSPLFGEPGVDSNLVTVRAGSLDDPRVYQPAADVYTSSAQPWDCMNPALPKFPKLPNS